MIGKAFDLWRFVLYLSATSSDLYLTRSATNSSPISIDLTIFALHVVKLRSLESNTAVSHFKYFHIDLCRICFEISRYFSGEFRLISSPEASRCDLLFVLCSSAGHGLLGPPNSSSGIMIDRVRTFFFYTRIYSHIPLPSIVTHGNVLVTSHVLSFSFSFSLNFVFIS